MNEPLVEMEEDQGDLELSSAIDRIGVTWTHYLSGLTLGGAWILNGMCVGVTPFFVDKLDRVDKLSHWEDGVLSASILVG